MVCRVVLMFVMISASDSLHRRHHHSRSPPGEHDLDRLLNRLDTRYSSNSSQAVTTSSVRADHANSLWDEIAADSGTRHPLDVKRWHDILPGAKEKQQEDEDDEMEAEDGFEDNLEQADSYRGEWDQKNGETISAYKWDSMGSRMAVDNLFQAFKSGSLKSDAKETQEMSRHLRQMAQETLCRWPRPKVVRVADLYGTTSKMYVPACTVIHQCSDDTGCCKGAGQTCGPKTTKRIELYFFTKYILGSQNYHRASNGVEKLPFYNHTECHCVDRLEEVMPRDGGPTTDYRLERTVEPGCRCPSEYTVRRLANGSCTCDCFDKQRDCIKYKRGNVYFNRNDQLCIEMGSCQQPSCDFGVYLRSYGRCPRKHEKLRTWSRHRH